MEDLLKDSPISMKDALKAQIEKVRQCKSFSHLLSLTFARIGHEAGLVKRVMDENLISWGYFTDHNIFEPHCNAHPNNFLVLDLEAPYNQDKGNLLAPLDFDMTYEFSTFVSIVEDNPSTFGKQDREQFDCWSGMEKYELEKALGGEENMANFDYGASNDVMQESEIAKLLEITLRDTCILNYRRSYDKVDGREWTKSEGTSWIDYQNQLISINALVRVALILTDQADT